MPGVVHPSTRAGDECIPADASESISARLSQVQDLRLPASLLRDHPYPSPAAVQEHLRELLSRDAGVFLEVSFAALQGACHTAQQKPCAHAALASQELHSAAVDQLYLHADTTEQATACQLWG